MYDTKDAESLINDITFFDMISYLDENDRTLMTLYYRDGYTTKDIAGMLNMNENTVRIKIKRARDYIKRRMKVEKDE